MNHMNKMDQKMIKSIIDTLDSTFKSDIKFSLDKKNDSKLHILDARPQLSAIGNRVYYITSTYIIAHGIRV